MPKAAALLFALLGLATPPRAQAVPGDFVSDWMDLTNAVWEADGEAAGPQGRTARTSRADAQVALAMFEALNAVERRYESYLGTPPAEPGTSALAAATAAAHGVLNSLFAGQTEMFEPALTLALAGVPDGPAEDAGVALGRRVAAAVVARAALPDGAVLVQYRPPTAPGVYVTPGLGSILPFDLAVPPFLLDSVSAIRPPPPLALTDARYAADLEEVRRLGGADSPDRPADKTLLARIALEVDYDVILGDVARRPSRSPVENARLHALARMAADDTWSAIMDAKMHYATWRPVTAIRNADLDGNDGTALQADWRSLLPTPTHPDYPCGHCGVAAAFATVLAAETGPAPEGGVRIVGETPGVGVTVATWGAFVDEMSMSRIYAGAHTRYANEVAEAMGRQVGRLALAALFRPLPARP